LVSKTGNAFGANGRGDNILLTATGIVENKGMQVVDEGNDRIRLSDWGASPVYAEGIPARVTLPVKAERVQCFSLDAAGNRMAKIPVLKLDSTSAEISIKPEYRTVWYEILIAS
jgi:hypothetical protein